MNGSGASKELAVRRKILRIYNKQQQDFPSLRAYNDYLEEIEDIIFNLAEGQDVPATEAKVKAYEDENREHIIIVNARRVEERREARAAAGAAGAGQVAAQERDANQASHAGGQPFYAPSMPPGTLAGAAPAPISRGEVDSRGPGNENGSCALEALALSPEEKHFRGLRAGGWTPQLGDKRALDEAFSTLWVD
eukprot:TRINITY_DN17179_c0_g2_i1.p1 TRINITY_DN17179_c0_g2~~TRINITY_DN17179_c0_g2_i1.p1  ORF type:complete len:193 (+),score=43.57 TRINITY_DN17179_c0_g2_i1:353-931(+)